MNSTDSDSKNLNLNNSNPLNLNWIWMWIDSIKIWIWKTLLTYLIKSSERTYLPVPKIHKDVLIKEIERLCKLGVLERQHYSEWASPSFIVPKKNGTVRFLSDFREVNKRLIRKPFPIPKISTVLQELEGFTFATALDLNMGYYTIRLDPDQSTQDLESGVPLPEEKIFNVSIQ